tara:strand:+ start:173 stop:1012 length:840 start_codon:yes stop_codon:yes gene_type:complete
MNDNFEKLARAQEFMAQQQQAQAAQQQQVYSVPTDFVKLPSKGKFYPKNHPLYNKEEVEVRYMTTKEEDILLSPAYIEKGVVFDKLVESILVNKYINVNSLFTGDKNAILINARKNAYGPEYSIQANCIQCEHRNKVEVDLDKLKNKEIDFENISFTEAGGFIINLPKTKAKVELKLLTGNDELEITKRTEQKARHKLPTSAVLDRYQQMFISVNGETDIFTINNFIGNMPIADSRYLRKQYLKYNPDVDFSFDFHCEKCGEKNGGLMPIMGDFFWPDD